MKTKYVYCAIAFCLLLSSARPAHAAEPLTGEQAMQHLKDTGQYESLAAALTGARYGAKVADGAEAKALAQNPAHGLRSTFTREGLRLEVRSGEATHQLAWRLDSLGYGAAQITVPAGELKVRGQRVELARGTSPTPHSALATPHLVEWFNNTPGGLEHGFTLAERPAANPRREALRLVVAVTGDLAPQADATGQNLLLRDPAGQTVLNYEKLKVWDATGAEMPATMQVADGKVTLTVPEANAHYPLTIDPTFTQQAYVKASNTGADDFFGATVAVSGDTVVIGAQGEDSGATGVNGDQSDTSFDAGAAYVFVRSGNTWSQQAYLKASNTGFFDSFGHSVAVSGDTVVVGAYAQNSSEGAVYVFERSGTNWTQQAFLKASNAGSGDKFGYSLAVSGDTVVVGAPSESSNATGINGDQSDNSATDAGAAYVFVRNGTTWSQQAYLKASNTGGGVPGESLGDFFGFSVAVSGNTVVVGAYYESSNATGVNGNQTDNSAGLAGAAYVFVRDGTTWTQQAYLKASNTGSASTEYFGYSVAVAGDTAVVGALGEDSNATGVNGAQNDNSASDAGAAYVFVRNGITWTQQAYLKASNTGEDDWFGVSVAVAGDTVVVGASQESSNATGVNGNQSDNTSSRSGAAYVFVRSGTNWTQQDYLKASNTDEENQFGSSVAVSGDTVVVGAYKENGTATGVSAIGPTPFPPSLLWTVGKNDNSWPVGNGGGANTTFVQESGTANPLPGNPANPEVSQQGDDDYYFAGVYTTVIAGNGAYVPLGVVAANEEGAERGFSVTDNDLRYHFNLPSTLSQSDRLTVTFDAKDLQLGQPDSRYGVEIYFNGVKVQSEILIRPAQLNRDFTTASFSLASVNAQTGPGFDNIVRLKGIPRNTQGGGSFMTIDYVKLNFDADRIPASGSAYIFSLPLPAAPELAVEQPAGTDLPDGGSQTFGSVTVGTNASLNFTVKNTGAVDLTGLGLTIDGPDAAQFAVTTNATAPVAGPTGSTTFTVQFAPTNAGPKTAVLHLANNDADENPFDLTLTGEGVAVVNQLPTLTLPASPLIAEATSAAGATVVFVVTANDPETGALTPLVAPASGSTFALGDTTVNASATDLANATTSGSFIVRVVDTTAPVLTLPSSPVTTVTASTAGAVVTFAVSASDLVSGAVAATAIPPSGNTFALGDTTVNVSAPDAAGNVATGSFVVRVTGAPEIAVEQPAGTDLVDGGSRAFGSVTVGTNASLSFTIKNTGAAELTGLGLTIDGPDAAQFTVTTNATAPVAGPADSTTFTVQFAPTNAGPKTAVLHLASNDADESPFDIAVTGTGSLPASLPPISTVTLTVAGLQLTLPVSGGQTVGVEYSETLNPGAWIDLGNVTVTAGIGSFTDSDSARLGKPHGFYRAILR